MECISGKIIPGGDCYQKSRIKNQEDSLTTAYSRNDSAQCRTPLSGIWVREHRIPSAHVPGTRSSSGYLACFASRFHRRLFTLSHVRGFRRQPEAPAELCLRLKEVVRSCGPAVFNRVPRTAYRVPQGLMPHAPHLPFNIRLALLPAIC